METDLDARSGRREGSRPEQQRRLKVAYVMSRFPKLTETFVLYEMLAVEEQGVDVALYPLLREREPIVHHDAVALCERAHFQPFLSGPILRSQLIFLWRSPRTYLGTLWGLLRGTWGSLNFFAGAVGIFPKVAHAARLMAAEGVDHVHCHFSNHPAAAGFIIHRLTGIPFSFTAHGFDLHVDRRMLCAKIAEASFVVPVSEYNRDLMVKECGDHAPRKLAVIHCGVDTRFFHPAEAAVEQGPLSILCVGKLHEVKGQAYLVEACRLLAEAGVDLVCNFVGDGPDRRALTQRIADSALEGRVSILGERDRVQIAALLNTAHVLAAPSVPTSSGKREGIPVVLMEAMSAGVPVVASRLSGIPELVEDEVSGLLVPPGDAAALAEALRRLHDDPSLRRRLGSAGREKVLEEFDVRRNAAELVRRFRGTRAAA
jgi:colanic acid/amylovoran biosynthesis glycosyltransferase